MYNNDFLYFESVFSISSLTVYETAVYETGTSTDIDNIPVVKCEAYQRHRQPQEIYDAIATAETITPHTHNGKGL